MLISATVFAEIDEEEEEDAIEAEELTRASSLADDEDNEVSVKELTETVDALARLDEDAKADEAEEDETAVGAEETLTIATDADAADDDIVAGAIVEEEPIPMVEAAGSGTEAFIAEST